MTKVSHNLPLDCYIEIPTVLTIGVFDGVHLGHRQLIEATIRRAKEIHAVSAVMTFDKHPRAVLQHRAQPCTLTPLPRKIDLIRALGPSSIIVLRFTVDVAKLTPDEFLQGLTSRVNLKQMLIGPDFGLGRNREGGFPQLQAIGSKLGFSVEQLPAFVIDNETVSSTAVRRKLANGDIRAANAMLGRPVTISGHVVSGARRGTTLGFPTANLSLEDDDQLLPPDGVYAVRVRMQDDVRPGVTNIGIRPTFDAGERSIETFILDYDGDVYGSEITLEIRDRIRGEMKFASAEDLTRQIANDVESARRIVTPQTRQVARP